mmetsp:Transcript_21563/g.44999  ORF Transcript_21563/g.44999 Transcript_21563/m.44999 type:complete len:111 (-) Transcript_21563:442-774(-)
MEWSDRIRDEAAIEMQKVDWCNPRISHVVSPVGKEPFPDATNVRRLVSRCKKDCRLRMARFDSTSRSYVMPLLKLPRFLCYETSTRRIPQSEDKNSIWRRFSHSTYIGMM